MSSTTSTGRRNALVASVVIALLAIAALAVHQAGSDGRMSDAAGAQLCSDAVTSNLDPDGTNEPRIITMNVIRTGNRAWRCAGTATVQDLAKPLPRSTRTFDITVVSSSDGSTFTVHST